MSFFVYLVQFNLFLLIYFAFYKAFLGRETFFSFNRWFLLGGVFCSLILPLTPVSWPGPSPSGADVAFRTMAAWQEFSVTSFSGGGADSTGISLFSMLVFVYRLGAGIALLLLTKRLGVIYRLIRRHQRVRKDGHYHIVTPAGTPVFSFCRYLFAPAGTQALICSHELVHIRGRHSLDILLLELVKVLCWFNPFVRGYQRTLKTVHEYIADAAVSGSSGKYAYAALLVRESFSEPVRALTHSFFNRSQLKKRLTMLQKTKSPKAVALKYALALPLIAVLLFISSSTFALRSKVRHSLEDLGTLRADALQVTAPGSHSLAAPAQNTITVTGTVVNEKKEPLSKVTVLVAGSSAGTLTDENGHFLLQNAPPNALLEFSMIGYAGRSIPLNNHAKLAVVLYPAPHNIGQVVVVGYGDHPATKSGDEKMQKNPVFTFVEQMPSFPGGEKEMMKYLRDNIRYPAAAREKHIVGTVAVTFIVNKDGSIDHITTRNNPLGGGLEEEAIRVVKNMPRWKPGMQNGKKVTVAYYLPIRFTLQ